METNQPRGSRPADFAGMWAGRESSSPSKNRGRIVRSETPLWNSVSAPPLLVADDAAEVGDYVGDRPQIVVGARTAVAKHHRPPAPLNGSPQPNAVNQNQMVS